LSLIQPFKVPRISGDQNTVNVGNTGGGGDGGRGDEFARIYAAFSPQQLGNFGGLSVNSPPQALTVEPALSPAAEVAGGSFQERSTSSTFALPPPYPAAPSWNQPPYVAVREATTHQQYPPQQLYAHPQQQQLYQSQQFQQHPRQQQQQQQQLLQLEQQPPQQQVLPHIDQIIVGNSNYQQGDLHGTIPTTVENWLQQDLVQVRQIALVGTGTA
jgi:hypothetical protein